MGLAERKERDKQELRDLILLKAKEIIIRDGQDKLSIRKIATEIEYSPATIYLYFQDKDEILYQMMQKGFELLANEMQEIFKEASAVKRVFHIGKAYVDFGMNHPDWYDLMFNSEAPMKHIERCRAEWGHGIAIFEFLVATCDEACKEQQVDHCDARLTALQLWSTVHGLVSLKNTQRLCVIGGDFDHNQEEAIIHKTLENLMKTIFHYNI